MLAQPPVSTTPESLRETRLQRLVSFYIATGMLFMLLPGTFLGVLNLLSISDRHALSSMSPAWLQAHGHAQIFGWIGTFVIGIGYYSLSKMGHLPAFAVSRGWLSWILWTMGVGLRWQTNVSLWRWRVLLPLSAGLELAAFAIFFFTVSRHKKQPARAGDERREGIPGWMRVVVASTVGFLFMLLTNLAAAIYLAAEGSSPAFPHWFDQRFLVLATWGFPVLAVWGFNARWFPVFLGLKQPSDRGLMSAAAICIAAVAVAMAGGFRSASALLLIASIVATAALRVTARADRPPKTQGVHASFPGFIRLCYAWLLAAAALSVFAANADKNGGAWGAARHALTVGFLAGMIFSIGPRILPAFCGMRQLFSPRLMLAASLLLNLGCLLRVAAEIPAYEANLAIAWSVLPISAVAELTAVTVFAANLAITLLQPPAHVKRLREAMAGQV